MTIDTVDYAASERRFVDAFRFEHRGEFWVLGLGTSGPVESSGEEIVALWEEFIRRQRELPRSVDHSVYISPCRSTGGDLTVHLGFASGWELEDPPAGMTCVYVPSQRYAVAQVRGDDRQVEETYRVLRGWIAEQERDLDDSAFRLEIHADPPEYPVQPFDFEIWLPVT